MRAELPSRVKNNPLILTSNVLHYIFSEKWKEP